MLKLIIISRIITKRHLKVEKEFYWTLMNQHGLKLKRKNKYFEDQSWLKRLNNPTAEFDQSPPT